MTFWPRSFPTAMSQERQRRLPARRSLRSGGQALVVGVADGLPLGVDEAIRLSGYVLEFSSGERPDPGARG